MIKHEWSPEEEASPAADGERFREREDHLSRTRVRIEKSEEEKEGCILFP